MDTSKLTAGTKVRSKKHGVGVVLDVITIAVVDFGDAGIKAVKLPSAERRKPGRTDGVEDGAANETPVSSDAIVAPHTPEVVAEESPANTSTPSRAAVLAAAPGTSIPLGPGPGQAILAASPGEASPRLSSRPAPSLSLKCSRPLYYMTHIDNLPSILQHGILSGNMVRSRGISAARIDNRGVQDLRDRVTFVLLGKRRALHDFAPLYFTVRTPMLYSRGHLQDRIVYVEVEAAVLDLPGALICDGNAASQGLRKDGGSVDVIVATLPGESCQRIYTPSRPMPSWRMSNAYAGPDALDQILWQDVDDQSWGNNDEKTRRKHAEALIPGRIPSAYF